MCLTGAEWFVVCEGGRDERREGGFGFGIVLCRFENEFLFLVKLRTEAVLLRIVLEVLGFVVLAREWCSGIRGGGEWKFFRLLFEGVRFKTTEEFQSDLLGLEDEIREKVCSVDVRAVRSD